MRIQVFKQEIYIVYFIIMNTKISLFLLCSFFFFVFCKNDFRALKVTRCNREKNHTFYAILKRKYVEGVNYYDITFTIKEDFDNNNRGYGELYKIDKSNKKRKIFSLKMKGCCKFTIEMGGPLYTEIVKQLNMPHPDTCPLEKGIYHLNWTALSFENVPILKFVPRGKFEVRWVAFSLVDQSEVTCQEALVQRL